MRLCSRNKYFRLGLRLKFQFLLPKSHSSMLSFCRWIACSSQYRSRGGKPWASLHYSISWGVNWKYDLDGTGIDTGLKWSYAAEYCPCARHDCSEELQVQPRSIHIVALWKFPNFYTSQVRNFSLLNDSGKFMKNARNTLPCNWWGVDEQCWL